MAAALLTGFAYTAVHTSAAMAARWPASREGERVLAEARILTIPVAWECGTTFDASLPLDPRAGGARVTARLFQFLEDALHGR